MLTIGNSSSTKNPLVDLFFLAWDGLDKQFLIGFKELT
jgi:hypothetical protein